MFYILDRDIEGDREMALSIKSEEADRLAREVASLTGESLTQVITAALKERLERERRRRARRGGIAERLNRIAEDCAALPDVDPRSPDEIIGYDEYGVPR
jgi:antitoxin VapB